MPGAGSSGPARCRAGPGRSPRQGRDGEVGTLDGLELDHRPSTLIGVELGRQLGPAETVHVPGAAKGEPAQAVIAPRVAHRRLVTRVRGRVWLETLSVSIAVAGLFGLLGLATVDADLTREWSGQASVPVLESITILGEQHPDDWTAPTSI